MAEQPLSLFDEAMAEDLQAIAEAIEIAAMSRQGDGLALLDLLRVLEQMHRQIRESLFRDALPTNRQRLYALLKDIEMNGGWPHIQRMKLRLLLEKFFEVEGDIDALPTDRH
ncbi:hypothetical protein C7271_09835 [filamentous cyanobacterium CCP5]|nr:hypothetical protein C7271_09835 [filamentous cyanobacterium CCP5]